MFFLLGTGRDYVFSSWLVAALWLQKWLHVTSKAWFSWEAHSWQPTTSAGGSPSSPWRANPLNSQLAASTTLPTVTVSPWVLWPLLEPPSWWCMSSDELLQLCQAKLHEQNNCCCKPLSLVGVAYKEKTIGTVFLTNVDNWELSIYITCQLLLQWCQPAMI